MTIRDTLPKKIFDNKAMTVDEIAEEVPWGWSKAKRFVNEKMESGTYEQVWKMVGNRPVKAYRLKKK